MCTLGMKMWGQVPPSLVTTQEIKIHSNILHNQTETWEQFYTAWPWWDPGFGGWAAMWRDAETRLPLELLSTGMGRSV